MIRHTDHHDGVDAVLRAKRLLVPGLLWVALAVSAVSSVVYDVGHWLNAW
jgi:hypothetical protein